MAVALDQPVLVVLVPDLLQGRLQVIHGSQCPDPEQVFLQRLDEALGTAVALRRADKGRWGFRAQLDTRKNLVFGRP